MRSRKASGPAAADTARKPRAVVSAGRQKHREATATDLTTQPGFLSVYDGTRHLGFLLLRGPHGVEAYTADCVSLGVYPDQKTAADAVTLAAGGSA